MAIDQQIVCLLVLLLEVGLTIQQDADVVCSQSPCVECIQSGKKCDMCPSQKKLAVECNDRGDLICGICKCIDGYSGNVCHIRDVMKRSTSLCMQPNSSAICSGRGECVSGICLCNAISSNSARKYSGKWCECDDYNCEYYMGNICGGPERGFCDCGVCNCEPGYAGTNCGCAQSRDTCIAKSNWRICNGHGVCICGICKCDPESGMMGPTCEDCPNCKGSCEKVWPCIECKTTSSDEGTYDNETCVKMCKFDLRETDKLSTDSKICDMRPKGTQNCVYEFSIENEGDDDMFINFVRRGTCPLPKDSQDTDGSSQLFWIHQYLFALTLCFIIFNML